MMQLPMCRPCRGLPMLHSAPPRYPSACLQARGEELAAAEESLEAWKAQFKAEAVRQIAERERLLTEWQARLDRRGAEVEEAQRAAEVRGGAAYSSGIAAVEGTGTCSALPCIMCCAALLCSMLPTC